MKIYLFPTQEEAAGVVARMILESLERKPDLVLGLATGSTPLEVYARLIRAHKENGVDFSRVRTFNLDEYLDLPADHRQSYRYFMHQNLFADVNIPPANIHFPPSEGEGLEQRCRAYEEAILAAGGIDIQILGIGSNGHIGFNEPTSSLASRTRVKTLADKTLRDNARFYDAGEEQPQMASTMGIGTILDARRILLQAFGTKKREAVRAAVEGPVSSICPASALQLHPRVEFFLDEGSAGGLRMLDYYRRTQQNDSSLRARGRF